MSADATPGRTFGRVADAYERTRPEYPIAVVEHAARELGLTRASTVLDLAAGTGKLTRVLRRCFDTVIAVEPDDAMRRHNTGALAGSAEAIPLPDDSVDAVFVAEAFHWFDAEEAVREIDRVLQPGGALVVIDRVWGEKAQPGLLPPELKADLDAVWARFHAPDAAFTHWLDTVALDGQAQLDERVRISGRDLVDLCLTASTPASIDDAERTAIAERAYPLMDDEYELHVPTYVYWIRR